jgi:hypothetical protein
VFVEFKIVQECRSLDVRCIADPHHWCVRPRSQ